MSALETAVPLVPPHGRRQWLRGLAADPRSAAGLVLVGLVVVAAVCAPFIAPFDPELPDFASTLAPPSGTHPLGTDELGRDVLARIVYGARASLYVGVLSVTLAAVRSLSSWATSAPSSSDVGAPTAAVDPLHAAITARKLPKTIRDPVRTMDIAAP